MHRFAIAFPEGLRPAGHVDGEDPFLGWPSRCAPVAPIPLYIILSALVAGLASFVSLAVCGCWALSELLLWAEHRRARYGYAIFDEDTQDWWASCAESMLQSVPCVALGRAADRSVAVMYRE